MADQFSVIISKLDESFNLQDTRNYGLSILFSEMGFAYAILDFKRNKFLGIHQLAHLDIKSRQNLPNIKTSFDEFLRNVFVATPWLKNPYKLIKVAYEGKKATLIPAGLFDQGERDNYLRFSFNQGQEEQIFSDHLIPMDAHQVFAVPASTVNSIRSHYPTVKLSHHSSVLIESIWMNFKNRISAHRVFLHVRDKYFDLVIFDGRQVSYFNTFPFHNHEDIVYYLIFVLEQLNYNPETMPLVLLGQVEKGGGLFELLSKYIRHIEFGRRNEAYRYSYLFNTIPPQSFYPLLNFFSCGL